jgi:phage tail-like protein
MSAFDFDAGTYQGRIAVSSGFAYELGHALPDQIVRIQNGDSNVLTQAADFSGASVTTVLLAIRAPSTPMPAGASWVIAAQVASDVFLNFTITESQALTVALPTQWEATNATSISVSLSLSCSGIVEVELPSVQVQQVVLGTVSSPVALGSVFPEPGIVQVPVSTQVVFWVEAVTASAVLSNASLYVNGVPAIVNGVGQNGWAVGSVFVAPSNAVLVVQATPPAPFAPSSVVSAHAYYTYASGLVIDKAWSFTTVDTVGPSIVSAMAPASRSVSVVWSEALGAVGTYALSLVSGAPAVTPNVVGTAPQPDGSVLLTLDIDQTQGAVYLVTATGTTDVYGNLAVGPSAQFVGYVCQRTPAGRWFQLFKMLLESDQASDDLRLFVGCYQEVTDLLLCKIDDFLADAVDPDTATEPWLDLLLADLGNPFPFDLTFVEKRRLVRLLVSIYKLKGTGQGIVFAVLFFVGVQITITTPWTTGWIIGVSHIGVDTVIASGIQRDLYSYYIVTPVTVTADQMQKIVAIAKYMQPAWTHLRGVLGPVALPPAPQHWQIGLSAVGVNTFVH